MVAQALARAIERTASTVTQELDVVIIGAGQAGLAVSYELMQDGVEHVVLERGRVGQTWRGWWDGLHLISPNWSVRLTGHAYDGDDPDGFMSRDEIVAWLERYAQRFGAPVREGIDVVSLGGRSGGGFELETSAGPIAARSVVLATGAYQRQHRPPGAASLPSGLLQLDPRGYRNPSALPDGGVLVVGSGQSGCQIADELREAGRDVYLACGRAPWLPRRIGDRDCIWWGFESGFFEMPLSALPSPAARLAANVQLTGAHGGRDLHYRTLQRSGVKLLGHFLGADGARARFAPDLAASVAAGDQGYAQLMGLVERTAAARGLPQPKIAEPEPLRVDAPESVDLRGLGAVIFASGFRPSYDAWAHLPGAFDELGFPIHEEGASIDFPGLYFVGVHFLRKRKSSVLHGVDEDAAIVAGQIAAQQSGGERRSAARRHGSSRLE
jgi:putative flavoprotein involved in K+ transport